MIIFNRSLASIDVLNHLLPERTHRLKIAALLLKAVSEEKGRYLLKKKQ